LTITCAPAKQAEQEADDEQEDEAFETLLRPLTYVAPPVVPFDVGLLQPVAFVEDNVTAVEGAKHPEAKLPQAPKIFYVPSGGLGQQASRGQLKFEGTPADRDKGPLCTRWIGTTGLGGCDSPSWVPKMALVAGPG
jgi:hypothetical protein